MARKSAFAAGAARATGERARRDGTPLIGVEPVDLPPVEVPREATTPRKAAPTATPRKAATTATPRKAATTATPRKKAAPPPAETTGAPRTRTRTHRPTPVVTSAPSAKAERQSGERPRVPRLSPKAKRLADERAGVRSHLRLAEAPQLPPADHDSFVSVAGAAGPQIRGGALGVLDGIPGLSSLPDVATFDVGQIVEVLTTILRSAAQIAGIAPEDVEAAVAQTLAYLRRRIDGDYEVDEFGYDADFTKHIFYPLLRPIYKHWFRVEVRGVENIPADGGALVVANHSGTVAIDSLMLQLAIHDEHPQQRPMRALGADLVFETPVLGPIVRRSGSTLATNADAERLFAKGELVAVFPEGFKGVGKPFKDRYKLQRFGRGGFVSAALKAQVPIIPVAIVGAEEIAPIIGNMTTIARIFGLPYAPITPTFPLLGPLGLIPLPSKWIIEFGEPIPTDTYGAEAADDPMLVFDLTDQVRETIQQSLHAVLMTRRSVFF